MATVFPQDEARPGVDGSKKTVIQLLELEKYKCSEMGNLPA